MKEKIILPVERRPQPYSPAFPVATSVEVITKARFRITVPTLQPACTYTNLVSFIATPVF